MWVSRSRSARRGARPSGYETSRCMVNALPLRGFPRQGLRLAGALERQASRPARDAWPAIAPLRRCGRALVRGRDAPLRGPDASAGRAGLLGASPVGCRRGLRPCAFCRATRQRLAASAGRGPPSSLFPRTRGVCCACGVMYRAGYASRPCSSANLLGTPMSDVAMSRCILCVRSVAGARPMMH